MRPVHSVLILIPSVEENTVIKLTYVLRRRPELSEEEFHRYWYEVHGPLVRSVKDVLRIKLYVQVHTIAEGGRRPGGMQEVHDGIAELWWDSMEDLRAPRETEEGRAAARLLAEDEAKFIDFSRSSIAIAEERPIIE
jgi:uncharacterized protein (TIGR02118 family)